MNRISWLINRIRVMTLREVLFRVLRMLLQHVEHYRISAGWQPVPEHRVKPRLALFGNRPEVPEQWQKLFSLDNDLLSAYMNGWINFFGHVPLNVGCPVAWQRDPVTGIEAPSKYGKSLNYRDDRIVGNVKFTWELGRHQHLVPIAVAYAVSGDLNYRQAVVDQLESWIEDNPFGLGLHWCSALEVALRLISWAVVHSLLVFRDGDQGLFTAVHNPERLGCSVYQQTRFVRYFLSRHSSANNHLIGELCGLWVSCRVFDMGEEGRRWSGFAQQELERQAALQVYPDGVDKEQAFYYHLWVLEYLLFAWLVGKSSGHMFSSDFLQRIVAMTHFLQDVSPDGSEPPQIGDGDDGFVTRFAPRWSEKPYHEMINAVYGVLGKTAEFRSEKAFWYQAMAGSGITNIPGSVWTRSYPAVYAQGGYVVLGGSGCHLVFDAGPLGYLGIAAHGHADALSFCLAVDGAWWLVDPGTYAYHSSPAWRTYFRGTAAHNTVRINGQDQSRTGGAFMWLKKARAHLENHGVLDEIQYVTGSHDGYRDAGIEHVREVRLAPAQCEIKVTDSLNGATTGEAEIFFHFAPDVQINHSTADNCWIAKRTDCDYRLMLYTDSLWQFESFMACTDPILGWYSPALEEKIPAVTLRGRANLSTVRRSVTRIVRD